MSARGKSKQTMGGICSDVTTLRFQRPSGISYLQCKGIGQEHFDLENYLTNFKGMFYLDWKAMAVKKECVTLYADDFLLLLKVRHLYVFFCIILGNRLKSENFFFFKFTLM